MITTVDPKEQLPALDFSDTEMSDEAAEVLRSLGLLRENSKGEPWRPETAEDADWVLWKALEMDREMAAIQARAAEKVERLTKARASFLSRYEDDVRAIAWEALPRKKDGRPSQKFVNLDRVKVKFTANGGGPKVTDEAAVLAWILNTDTPQLWKAVQATVTLTGQAALLQIRDQPEGVKPKILHAPVKAYVEETSPIPGVEIIAPSERMSFE